MNKPARITGRKKMITGEELNKILDLAFGEDFFFYAFFFLTASLGLRVGEACKLKISDIEGNQIRITNSKQFKEIEPFSYLPLTGSMHNVINELMRQRIPSRYDWLFPSSQNQSKPIGKRTVQRVFSEYAERCGIRASIHCLRHFCGTKLYEQSRDIKLVKTYLRHRSLSSSDIYTHPSQDYVRRRIEEMEPIVKDKVGGGGRHKSHEK